MKPLGKTWRWRARGFREQVVVRVVAIALCALVAVWLGMAGQPWVLVALFAGLGVYLVYRLVDLVETSNRQLQLFLESIRYSDFSASFTQGNRLGPEFRHLNEQFNDVITAFRRTRAEREENMRYLDTVVQHVSTGLIAFDASGAIQLLNNTARQVLGGRHLRDLRDLQPTHPELHQALLTTPTGSSSLVRLGDGADQRQYSLRATEFRMRGKAWKLVALQDIHLELEQKEVEAWRNLARVLRHEIMNSITPISSLSGTIRDLVQADAQPQGDTVLLPAETFADLEEGLQTIAKRSEGLVQFVDAYRTFTSLPTPVLSAMPVSELFHRIQVLTGDDLTERGIRLVVLVQPPGLVLTADPGLLEMVLLNLVKNAAEALSDAAPPPADPAIVLQARDDGTSIVLEVIDNGPGIVPEALGTIFIPFYSTKRGGSGIGLAWSRQILHQHHGTLTVQSVPDVQTVFTLRLPHAEVMLPQG